MEDATAGTHVCTLTVTPGAGNELELIWGRVVTGATATAQTITIFVDDGANVLATFAFSNANTSNAAQINVPNYASIPIAAATQFVPLGGTFGRAAFISGTMRLVLQVSTAAVSVTQTFAVVCRLRGAIPTATLNDTIGTSVNTTNTNQVF